MQRNWKRNQHRQWLCHFHLKIKKKRHRLWQCRCYVVLNVWPHHAIVFIPQQLWTSAHETLCLENEDAVHFFQMLNRHTLAADSEKLFKNGGMLLIKAMTRSIVISPRAIVGTNLPSAEYSTPATGSPLTAVVRDSVESCFDSIDYHWRGGSVPFEMVRALSRNFAWFTSCIYSMHQGRFFFPRRCVQISCFPCCLVWQRGCSWVCCSSATVENESILVQYFDSTSRLRLMQSGRFGKFEYLPIACISNRFKKFRSCHMKKNPFSLHTLPSKLCQIE